MKIEGRKLDMGDINEEPMSEADFFNHLIIKNRFKKIGSSTLIYVDDTDSITVSVRKGVVIITSDGMNGVIPHWQMMAIRTGPDCFFWDGALQDVLACF